ENAAVPSTAPDRVVDFASVIKAQCPHDQGDQNQEKGNVEPGEHGSVPVWECGKHRAAGGDEPDFIAGPDRTDGREHDAPASLTVEASSVAAKHGKQCADTEVEPLQNEIPRPQHGNEDEPNGR